MQNQPLPVCSEGAVRNAGSGVGRKLQCPLLCVCLMCGALVIVSPCERAALSTMTALTSSKRLATCATSAKPLPATLSW